MSHNHPDSTAPTITFDDPPDLTPRVPERAFVIIRVNPAGDIESTTVVDGFYYVELSGLRRCPTSRAGTTGLALFRRSDPRSRRLRVLRAAH